MQKYASYILTIVILGFLNWQCAVDKNPIVYPVYLQEEQKAIIYRTILDSLVLREGVERVVFTDSTDFFPLSEDILSHIPGLDSATLHDYNWQNQNSIPFQLIPGLGIVQLRLSRKEFQNILQQGGWELFYQYYPYSGGLIGMSNIGMNRSGSQALVYLSWQFHYLAGSGTLIFLMKNSEWQIVQVLTVWIS